ncbi:hypothetical protein BH11ACT3_BH11ACT3_12530 [soil metagenome]
MGTNEDELVRIVSAGHYRIPQLELLRVAIANLATSLNKVSANPGFGGESSDAASERLLDMRKRYLDIDGYAGDIQGQIDRANAAVDDASKALANLPDAQVPPWVHVSLATAKTTIPFPGLGPVLVADGAVGVIENFLGSKREEAAGAAVTEYGRKLGPITGEMSAVRYEVAIASNRQEVGVDAYDIPDTSGPTGVGGPVGPSYTGNYSSGSGTGGFGGSHPPQGPVIVDPGYNPDDGGPALAPPTTSTGGTGGAGGGGSAGGLSPALGGVVGGGIGMAGALTGARMGSGFGGGAVGVGAAPRLGSGGLLGNAAAAGKGGGVNGVAGGTGTAGSAGAGTNRTGAGSRGGRGLSGAGTGAHGKDEKRKPGRGLGGPIAPKLDDDELLSPRAAGTRAGGRDDANDLDDALGDE